MAKFKDRTEVKTKVNGVYPWDFAAPSKDTSHSGGLPAGNYYGVGHAQPIGKESASGPEGGPIPQTSKCWSPNEAFKQDKRG